MTVALDMATIVNTVVIGVIAYTAKTLLATTKGLAIVQKWAEDHEKQDDERHTGVNHRLARVEDRLAG